VKPLLVLMLLVPSVAVAQKDQPVGPREGRHPGEGRVENDTMPLPQARRAWSLGVVGYTGGAWQPSGMELAMLWRVNSHTATSAGVTLGLGTFVQDQAVLLGQTRGFFAALGATVRQPLVELASVGSDRYPSALRLEAALDLAGSADVDSPLQGKWDGRGGFLLGFTFGNADPLGQSVAFYAGPAVLVGQSTSVHPEFAFRLRMPVGRRGR
jgi:hypothetical protein